MFDRDNEVPEDYDPEAPLFKIIRENAWREPVEPKCKWWENKPALFRDDIFYLGQTISGDYIFRKKYGKRTYIMNFN